MGRIPYYSRDMLPVFDIAENDPPNPIKSHDSPSLRKRHE